MLFCFSVLHFFCITAIVKIMIEVVPLCIIIICYVVNVSFRFRECGDSVRVPTDVFNLLTGRDGSRGGASGVAYTRWGRTSCPTSSRTTKLYSGRVVGSNYNIHGGGANYLCAPDNVQYLDSAVSAKGSTSALIGTEYEGTLAGTQNHNVPCSVCYAENRGVKLMIPASISCPSSWTVEYRGFLVTSHDGHRRNNVYECLDENAENIPNSQHNTDGALFYHVIGTCAAGAPCPPFQKNRVIACVVCTK